MVIRSLENEKVKKYRKLQKKKYRDLYGEYIVEGWHSVLEAYKSGVVEEIIIVEDYEQEEKLNSTYIYVSLEVMMKISSMDTPSKIIALCRKKKNQEIKGDKILLLDDIQDPGNLGTIIRSAVAFNIETIILSEKTVDLYNNKVLRATQGMIFHINIITMNLEKAIEEIKKRQIKILGTDVEKGINILQIDKKIKEKYALIMGNEGCGVKKEIKDKCDYNLYIKLNKKVESLNVGVACSILLYELNRE